MSTERRVPGSGGAAEQLVADYLRRTGYILCVQNYCCPHGELDIVARDGDVLCFIEVKFRSSDNQGHPLESITPAKQRKISLAALAYMQNHGLSDEETVRFDVVAVTLDEDVCDIQLVPGAFDSCV